MTKIYSPSQTTKFLECPAEWWMYKQGWRPRRMSRGTLSAIMGSGVHKALGEHYRCQRRGTPQEMGEIASQAILAELTTYSELGFECPTRELDLKAALPLKGKALTEFYIENDPIPEEWQHDQPELQLHDYGHCRIDLPVMPVLDRTSYPLDWKTKLRMDPRYAWKTKQEWEYSWQFMHYAWALEQYNGVPVDWFYVVWLSLEPKPQTEMLDIYIDPELMELWKRSAQQAWKWMKEVEDGDAYPLHDFQWFKKWGKSDFAEAFLDYKLHEDLMQQDYVNIGDRRL